MAENKRQHYVPQFYLRRFSQDGKNLGVFNLRQDKGFYGPIRTMCSESYFYGKNIELEKSLAPLESKVSEVICKIISSQKLPDIPIERVHLLTFMLLQHGRTAAARDAAKRRTKQISDVITQSMGVSDFSLKWDADHTYTMLLNLTAPLLIMDLNAVLLVNKTKRDFIVSDNPVILHNAKFNNTKGYGTKGMQSRGLQIFWPITKSCFLLLYDPLCYDIANERAQRVDLYSEEDIFALNAFQYLSCREVLLFTTKDDEDYVREIGKRVKQLRKEGTEVVETYPHPKKPNAELVHFYREDLDYNPELSFIRIKDGVSYGVRDPISIKEHERFLKEAMQRNTSAAQPA